MVLNPAAANDDTTKADVAKQTDVPATVSCSVGETIGKIRDECLTSLDTKASRFKKNGSIWTQEMNFMDVGWSTASANNRDASDMVEFPPCQHHTSEQKVLAPKETSMSQVVL